MRDIYYASVGRGYSLLLNLPVDRRGLVHENDIKRLMELKESINKDFAHNILPEATLKADNVRGNSSQYAAENVADDDKNTYWATDDGLTQGAIEITFAKPTAFNRFLVQEPISFGQRVKKFKLEYENNGKWLTIEEGTTIGYKRLLRFDTVTATKVRFTILEAKSTPLISNMGIYLSENTIQ